MNVSEQSLLVKIRNSGNMNFVNAQVNFKLPSGIPGRFYVVHNLGNQLQSALTNWLVRTDQYTIESFIDYVHGKPSGHVVMTEEQWLRLNS